MLFDCCCCYATEASFFRRLVCHQQVGFSSRRTQNLQQVLFCLHSWRFLPDKMSSNLLEEVLLELESMGSIKFGDFTLKSGLKSPVYFDLRLMVSCPKLMKNIATLLHEVGDTFLCLIFNYQWVYLSWWTKYKIAFVTWRSFSLSRAPPPFASYSRPFM